MTKNRFDGSVGRVPLEFVRASLSMCGFGKKDNTTKALGKGSKKVTSDIDMISISSTPVIQKAAFSALRQRTFPGFTKFKKDNQEGNKTNCTEVEGIRTFQGNVSDSIRSKSLDVLKSPVTFDKVETRSEAKKLDAKKLYSKTVASLVAKHIGKNGLQERKVATSYGRLKSASSSTTTKK